MLDQNKTNHPGQDLPPEEPDPSAGSKTGKGKARAKTKSRRSRRKTPRSPRFAWRELRDRIQARLATLDREKLKQVLLACGLGVAVVAAVLLAIKMLPVGLALLALLGLGMALRFWERLTWLPRWI